MKKYGNKASKKRSTHLGGFHLDNRRCSVHSYQCLRRSFVMKLPQFLARPGDFHIFDLDPSNNCYRSYSTREVTYPDGTRPNAQDHFTFDILTENFGFIPITETGQLEHYEQMHDEHVEFVIWQSRSDGHGGRKGGTIAEFRMKKWKPTT